MGNDQFIFIEVDDARLKALLRKVHDRLADMTPVMRRIGEYLFASVQENFEQGGRYSAEGSWMGGSRKWKPLSPVTVKRRTERGRWPGKILIQNARLASSLHVKADRDSAALATNVPYGKVHQYGAKKGEFGKKTFIQHVREHLRRVKGSAKKTKVRAHERKITLALPWGNIPARPFMVAQPEDVRDIEDLLMSYITAQ